MSFQPAHVEGEDVSQMSRVSDLHALVDAVVAKREENLVLQLEWATS